MSLSEGFPRKISHTLEEVSPPERSIRELDSILSGVLEERYPDRHIELMRAFATAFKDIEPVSSTTVGMVHSNIFDIDQQKAAVAKVLWSFLQREEYKGGRFSPKDLPKRLALLKDDARAHLFAFVDTYDSVLKNVLQRLG